MYIEDGYTRTATVPKVDDSTPEFEISYRPILHGERGRLAIGTHQANQSGDNDRMLEWEQRTVATIHKAIQSWTLKDSNGRAIKPTVETIRRLDAAQYQAVYDFVCGYAVPKSEKEDDSDATADLKN